MLAQRMKREDTGLTLSEQFRAWSLPIKMAAAAFATILGFFGVGVLGLCGFLAWSVISALIDPVAGVAAAGIVVMGLCALAAYTVLSR
jgi:hypothetical protein